MKISKKMIQALKNRNLYFDSYVVNWKQDLESEKTSGLPIEILQRKDDAVIAHLMAQREMFQKPDSGNTD